MADLRQADLVHPAAAQAGQVATANQATAADLRQVARTRVADLLLVVAADGAVAPVARIAAMIAQATAEAVVGIAVITTAVVVTADAEIMMDAAAMAVAETTAVAVAMVAVGIAAIVITALRAVVRVLLVEAGAADPLRARAR